MDWRECDSDQSLTRMLKVHDSGPVLIEAIGSMFRMEHFPNWMTVLFIQGSNSPSSEIPSNRQNDGCIQ